jgi:hypothetical protein
MFKSIKTPSWISTGLLGLALSVSGVWADAPATKTPTPYSKPLAATLAAHDLGEAVLANQVLRVVLHTPVTLSLFNSRGQLLYSAQGRKGLEIIPLKSIDFGFLYLTLRQGPVEQTFRLLHDGK